MVRLNITMPEEVVKQLQKVPNKSRFIAEAVREKMRNDEMKKLKAELIEGYKASAEEDKEVAAEWDCTVGDGIE
ncbi:MAG TPA: hypothetical protein VI749_01535 [Candidatus Omnitrophota bacterium]|nr:hypothetical protein [Candidatus Omnitrophota bacterium]